MDVQCGKLPALIRTGWGIGNEAVRVDIVVCAMLAAMASVPRLPDAGGCVEGVRGSAMDGVPAGPVVK